MCEKTLTKISKRALLYSNINIDFILYEYFIIFKCDCPHLICVKLRALLTQMMMEKLSVPRDSVVQMTLNVNEDIGKDTVVSILATDPSDLDLQLTGPNNFTKTKSEEQTRKVSLDVPDTMKVSNKLSTPYIYAISSFLTHGTRISLSIAV